MREKRRQANAEVFGPSHLVLISPGLSLQHRGVHHDKPTEMRSFATQGLRVLRRRRFAHRHCRASLCTSRHDSPNSRSPACMWGASTRQKLPLLREKSSPQNSERRAPVNLARRAAFGNASARTILPPPPRPGFPTKNWPRPYTLRSGAPPALFTCETPQSHSSRQSSLSLKRIPAALR